MKFFYKSYDYNFKRINFKLKENGELKYIILNTLRVDSPIHTKIKIFYNVDKKYKISSHSYHPPKGSSIYVIGPIR
jgi:hypothetical protein